MLNQINDPTLWHYIQYPADLFNMIGIHLPNMITNMRCMGNQCVVTIISIKW